MRRLRRTLGLAAIAAATAMALSACVGQSAPEPSVSPSPTATATPAFPVTITSALGDATILRQPTRVATWGWGATDAVLALGVQPVAIPAGGDAEGRPTPGAQLPWITDAVDRLGGTEPVALDISGGLPIAQLLKTRPDVLIAPNSAITQAERDAVVAAGIPVVAYPVTPWGTPWRQVITITAEALGLQRTAERVLDGLDAQVQAAQNVNPDFAGTTIAYVDAEAGTISVHLPADPRVGLLEELGFVTPASVRAHDPDGRAFSAPLAVEDLAKIDADVIVTDAADDASLEEFVTSPRARLIPAVRNHAVAGVVGVENAIAMAPTALTVPWILSSLIDRLAGAVAASKN